VAEPTTKISPQALARLMTLPGSLKANFGVAATQSEIVSALVHGITVAQLAGMVNGYHRYTSLPDSGGADDEGDPTGPR
jgi:hypothetical protein